MYVVIARRAFQNVEDLTLQRVCFNDADEAVRHAQRTSYGYTEYGAMSVERVDVAPTNDTLLRIVIPMSSSKTAERTWIEVRSDLQCRPGTFDI